MAPGLMPGDVVSSNAFPVIDRLRQPARFERWILDAPGAGTAVKRVGGLPGEVVALRGGDLAADGRVVLKGPPALAEIATEVARHDGRRSLVLPGGEILDDAAFATEVNRELLPVRDAGIVAVVRAGPAPGNEPSVVIAVGPRRITWRLAPAHRACFVAGRLDGHMVATAWRLPSDAPLPDRGCLPTPAAVAWSHREPWPVAETTDDHARPGVRRRGRHRGRRTAADLARRAASRRRRRSRGVAAGRRRILHPRRLPHGQRRFAPLGSARPSGPAPPRRTAPMTPAHSGCGRQRSASGSTTRLRRDGASRSMTVGRGRRVAELEFLHVDLVNSDSSTRRRSSRARAKSRAARASATRGVSPLAIASCTSPSSGAPCRHRWMMMPGRVGDPAGHADRPARPGRPGRRRHGRRERGEPACAARTSDTTATSARSATGGHHAAAACVPPGGPPRREGRSRRRRGLPPHPHEPQARADAELPGNLLHARPPVGQRDPPATGERHGAGRAGRTSARRSARVPPRSISPRRRRSSPTRRRPRRRRHRRGPARDRAAGPIRRPRGTTWPIPTAGSNDSAPAIDVPSPARRLRPQPRPVHHGHVAGGDSRVAQAGDERGHDVLALGHVTRHRDHDPVLRDDVGGQRRTGRRRGDRLRGHLPCGGPRDADGGFEGR